MSSNRLSIVFLALAAASPALLAQPAPPSRPLSPSQETALALSACPPAVATKAAVYLLGSSGYTKSKESQNGFTAIVEHSQPGAQEPQCMDAEGTRTHLPRILKVAELKAQGKSPEAIQRFVADGFASGLFQAPVRPGVDYMLSTENIVATPGGQLIHYPPHLMFYGPYLTNADLGSDGSTTSTTFVVEPGTPQALIIVPIGAPQDHQHPTSGGGGSSN